MPPHASSLILMSQLLQITLAFSCGLGRNMRNGRPGDGRRGLNARPPELCMCVCPTSHVCPTVHRRSDTHGDTERPQQALGAKLDVWFSDTMCSKIRDAQRAVHSPQKPTEPSPAECTASAPAPPSTSCLRVARSHLHGVGLRMLNSQRNPARTRIWTHEMRSHHACCTPLTCGRIRADACDVDDVCGPLHALSTVSCRDESERRQRVERGHGVRQQLG